ncbi:MAG: LptA/OstA family protein [Kiritimatiellia bacterium]
MKICLFSLLCLTLVQSGISANAVTPTVDDDGMSAAKKALLAPALPAPATKTVALRDTKITADKMEYNYKETVAIMTDNVIVDDARFHLTSDKLFVFLDGTNNLSQLVVIGNVAVSNENRRATCQKAVYTKKDAKLVMVGKAKLTNIAADGKKSHVRGDKITIWTDDQRMEVYPRPILTLPAGATDGLKDMM